MKKHTNVFHDVYYISKSIPICVYISIPNHTNQCVSRFFDKKDKCFKINVSLSTHVLVVSSVIFNSVLVLKPKFTIFGHQIADSGSHSHVTLVKYYYKRKKYYQRNQICMHGEVDQLLLKRYFDYCLSWFAKLVEICSSSSSEFKTLTKPLNVASVYVTDEIYN